MKAIDEVKKRLSAHTELSPGYEEERMNAAYSIDRVAEAKAHLARGNISKLRDIVRWKRNTVGRILGIGGCSHCGDRWNWKREHVIPCQFKASRFCSSSGMFPYCEQCHKCISKPLKVYYVTCLVLGWVKQHPRGLWYTNGQYFYYFRRLLAAWISVLRGL